MTQPALSGQAAVYVGPRRKLELRRYPLTPPAPGSVLLKLQRSGICGTDVHICAGRLPLPLPRLILGHEFIGRVLQLGGKGLRDGLGRVLRVGDTAIASVALPCGVCFNCRRGETASCLQFGVTYLRDPAEAPHFHGGYGEYLFSPATNLVTIPPGVELDAVAAFACAGPTVIRAFAFAGGVEPGELVVVQGTGPVGLFAIAWAASAGCHVVAIGSGSNSQRQRLARTLGAELVLDYRRASPAQCIDKVQALARRLKRGNGADVVVEASGAPGAIPVGLELLRTLGRYLVPGQYSNSGAVEIQPQLITFKALKIIGSGQYKLADVGAYVCFLRQHPELQAAFARCITHRYGIDQANEAMHAAAQGKSVKGVFVA